jgi:hypothetical protein
VERNVHFATVETPSYGSDPFELFTKQLQEPMHRYRAFTRTLALATKDPAQQQIGRSMKVAVPESRLQSWINFNHSIHGSGESPPVYPVPASDRTLVESLASSSWDAVFVDVRAFDKQAPSQFQWKEHMDFVIPDSFLELVAIRKLIELIMSDEFWMWIETQRGCDIALRGLVE